MKGLMWDLGSAHLSCWGVNSLCGSYTFDQLRICMDYPRDSVRRGRGSELGVVMRFIPLSGFCQQSHAFLFTGFGRGRIKKKKMLVGSLATSWFPVALSALWMPAPHITVHAGVSLACPQGCF